MKYPNVLNLPFIKKLNRLFFLNRLDWITRHEILFSRIQSKFNQTRLKNSQLNNRKRILFWDTSIWERGSLELMLAYALLARGHKIQGIMCGGRFPSCSMESVLFKRDDDCNNCSNRFKRFLTIFNLKEYFKEIYLDKHQQSEIIKSLDGLSVAELVSYKHHGIELGKQTLRDMPQYFFKLVDLNDPMVLSKFKESLCSAILYTNSALEAIETFQPDLCVVTSGKTISYSPLYEVCKFLKRPVLTWDEGGFEPHSFVFSVCGFK